MRKPHKFNQTKVDVIRKPDGTLVMVKRKRPYAKKRLNTKTAKPSVQA